MISLLITLLGYTDRIRHLLVYHHSDPATTAVPHDRAISHGADLVVGILNLFLGSGHLGGVVWR